MTNVSTSGFYESSITSLNKLRQSTNKLQQQISTSNKLTASSDDPLAAAQMRAMQAEDAMATATTANSNAAKTRLNQTDDVLSQVTNIVTQLQTLATQAANATLGTSDRQAVGTQITAYYSQLMSLANTKDSNGNPLFGGQGTGNAYSLDASGNLVYNGTSSAATVSVGTGVSVTTGVTGPEFLNFTASDGSSKNLLSMVKTLGETLTNSATTSADAIAAAQTAQKDLTASLDTVDTTQTVVGTRLNWISTTSTLQTGVNTQRTTRESSVGGTDLTSAAAELTQQMTVLEAAQASFVKLSSLSLFSLLN